MKRPYRTLDAERFAHKWNHSKSVQEVACQCGMSARNVSAIACRLRREKPELKLKHFPSGPARKFKGWKHLPDPTPVQIQKACEEIRKTWSEQNEQYHRTGDWPQPWEVPERSPIRTGRRLRASEVAQE